VGILDALALIRLRRTLLSHFGGKLAHLLLVAAVNDDLVGAGNLNGDAGDLLHGNLVGEAQVHDQLVALLGHTVADAVHVQLLLIALGDAHHHVVDQGPGQAVQSAVLLGVVGTGDVDDLTLLLDLHVGVELTGQGALGALHGDHVLRLDLNLHAGGDGDMSSTNSRHSYNPPYHTNARTS